MKDSKKFGMSTREFYLPIYRAGDEVLHKGNMYIIDMIYISDMKIFLKLRDIPELIESSNVEINGLTRFEIKRKYGN